MTQKLDSRKRKANARDSLASSEAALYDELGNGFIELDHESQSDSAASSRELQFSDEEDGISDEDSIESVEVPPEENAEEFGIQKPHPSTGPVDVRKREQRRYEDEAQEIAEEVAQQSLRPFKIEEDANGEPKYIYEEIEPIYDSDDSEAPPDKNTIGNIPLSFYDAYPHIGYDINGKRVQRPAKGTALDSLLDTIEIPEGWTGLTDPATGKPLELSAEELDVLRKVARNEAAGEGYDPYPEMVEYFTSRTEQMPLSAAPEPKRRFVPSRHEHKRVMKMVKAIKEGRIKPYKPSTAADEEEKEPFHYDVWANEAARPDHPMNIPAPKLPPPGYDESYHPPPEYLPDEQERQAWEEQDEEERTRDYLPSDHSALRRVPGYAQFIKDKFERCLDLYLAPRVRRSKLNIDPESLLPKLPDPDDLRPFPSKQSMKYRGHTGIVRSVAAHQSGLVFASGGDDGNVFVWAFEATETPIWKAKLSDTDAVNAVAWRPGNETAILCASAGEHVFLIAPDISIPTAAHSQDTARQTLTAGFAMASPTTNGGSTSGNAGKWQHPVRALQEQNVELQVTLRAPVKSINWHRRGDHFVTVSPSGQRSALAIHTLSKHLTQLPLRSLKGYVQYSAFHPSKPILFVATQRTIRSYDLAKQELLKTLLPGSKWISAFDVHAGGDNLIVSSYDKRLLWMDVELSDKPYKTLRYHTRGIRTTKFHKGGLPLLADASDDGSIQIFHGKVTNDLMENATIVPLTVLRGHEIKGSLGVMDVDWLPEGSGLLSAGADGTIRLWTQ